MGAWDTGAFDNDSAADFAGSLEDCSSDEARNDLLTATLGAMVEHDFTARPMDEGYEFPYEIEFAIAAAAYVADARNGRADFTDNAFARAYDRASDEYVPLVFAPISDELLQRARTALEKLLERMEVAGIGEEWMEPSRVILAALNE